MNKIMQGFPPVDEARATLANWRKAPWTHWSFHHVREIVPSAEIANDPEDVWALPKGELALPLPEIEAAMDAVDADAVVVLHEDKLVWESYRNGSGPADPHIIFSVSKSLLGLVAGTLIEKGEISGSDLAETYVPELIGTAYEGVTIDQLLDMRAGVLFTEDYLAASGPIVDYRYAANWNPVPAGVEPGDLRSFMSKMVDREGAHGRPFHYALPNTDLLGWVFERATGQRFADLLSKRLLKPLGAERPAYITVDRIGGARAAGGVCVTPRDLARVAMMIANGGAREGKQVIPASWIEEIATKGDQQAWREGDFKDKFGTRPAHYRAKCYVVEPGEAPLILGSGIHGQHFFADPARKLGIAWVASRDEPTDQPKLDKVMAAIEAIRGAAS